jgi:hypothetical protein
MAIVTFSFEAGNNIPRILEAFAATYGYKPTLPDGSTNPETKAMFAKRMLRQHIVDIVRQYEQDKAREEAAAAVGDIMLKITD